MLKYTYVYGYFLADKDKQHLFEHHQTMLEEHTETLHGCTEMKLESMDRVQIVNLVRVGENFVTSLLNSLMDPDMDDDAMAISAIPSPAPGEGSKGNPIAIDTEESVKRSTRSTSSKGGGKKGANII